MTEEVKKKRSKRLKNVNPIRIRRTKGFKTKTANDGANNKLLLPTKRPINPGHNLRHDLHK